LSIKNLSARRGILPWQGASKIEGKGKIHVQEKVKIVEKQEGGGKYEKVAIFPFIHIPGFDGMPEDRCGQGGR
jgi:hypothetical protein